MTDTGRASDDTAIVTYFSAERRESLIFMMVAFDAVAVAAWLLLSDSAYAGVAYPFVGVAIIQFAVGFTVYSRTAGQLATLRGLFASDRARFAAEEGRRMAGVMRNFSVYKAIELTLLGAGIAGLFAFRGNQMWYAVSLGLVIQCIVMLGFDFFAERRGIEYSRFVDRVATE